MAIDLEQYQRLKDKVEKTQAEVARAEGALDQQMKKLLADFGCESVEDADHLLLTLKEKEEKLERKYGEEIQAFEKKWGDKI